MKKSSLILLTLTLLLTSCQTSTNPINFSVSNVLSEQGLPVNPFNTAIALTMFNQRDIERSFPKFEAEIHRLHRLFDSYNYYQVDGQRLTNLKVINDSYGTGQVLKVDQDIITLLTHATEMMKLTEGYFNPTLGILIDIWSPLFIPFAQELGNDPDPALISAALNCQANLDNIDQILKIDTANLTVQFNQIPQCQGRAKLALGAIAKGYAMERVKPLLGNLPYLIDGGRSSLITNGINPNPSRDNWNVVILTPYLGTTLAIAALNGAQTITTSGDYENSFLKANPDGSITVRHHILNPYTGYSENHYRSFTILSDKEAGLMDALGTALFNIKDYQKIQSIINAVSQRYDVKIEILYQQEVIEAASKSLKISLTPGFNNALINDTISELVKERVVLN
jgi:thiamine biosynthesis lipoprotein ApbE